MIPYSRNIVLRLNIINNFFGAIHKLPQKSIVVAIKKMLFMHFPYMQIVSIAFLNRKIFMTIHQVRI